jgi:hypothetical protein
LGLEGLVAEQAGVISVINIVILERCHAERDGTTEGQLIIRLERPVCRGRANRIVAGPEITQRATSLVIGTNDQTALGLDETAGHKISVVETHLVHAAHLALFSEAVLCSLEQGSRNAIG